MDKRYMSMPKNRDEFERNMVWAFECGMVAGYGIEHTNIREEEAEAVKEFAVRNGFKRKSV